MQIYADNRVDTPQGKRDIIFSFHHTEEETAQYDNWQSGKKNFTLDMDSSKPDESEYLGTFRGVYQQQIETDHRQLQLSGPWTGTTRKPSAGSTGPQIRTGLSVALPR